jgi:hypothetical protein
MTAAPTIKNRRRDLAKEADKVLRRAHFDRLTANRLDDGTERINDPRERVAPLPSPSGGKAALRALADLALQSGVPVQKCSTKKPRVSDLQTWARARNKQNCHTKAPKATRPRGRRHNNAPPHTKLRAQ